VHEYQVRVDWTRDRQGELVIQGKPKLQVAPPPEFEGPAGILTPEDMFVAAASACFMTTFISFSKKTRFDFNSFSCQGIGTLEKVEKGYEFTKIVLKTKVTVSSDDIKQKAERALDSAGKYCLVANSMKCQVVHENTVTVK
jgi:organic hydroperoxide reductase OsmC/OhrA